MSTAALPTLGSPERRPPIVPGAVSIPSTRQKRIPGAFQFALAIYVIFTGTLPTIIQAIAFGVTGGSGTEFAAAMATGVAFDLLLLLPIVVLSNHPLGILHPLVLAVVLWPLVIHMPNVIQDAGGWAGALSGTPVQAPSFLGLPGRAASAIWTGIAKDNTLELLALSCTYIGFWALRPKTNATRLPVRMPRVVSVRNIMVGLIALSILVLVVLVRVRGGVNEHLTSLGAGRFVELSTFGPALFMIDLGATALFIWVATSADEVKRPIFMAALAAVAAAAFISNGSRGGALEVPLMVGLIWALKRRKIPWKIAIAIIPFMFLAIGFLGAIRTSSWAGTTAAQTAQKSSWSQSFARAQQEVIARNGADANVPVIMRGFDVSGGPLFGRSYASAITSVIPRPLWPDKPRGVGSLYAQLFLGAKMSGTSIPVSPAVEMYWNFGFPGVILLSIFYGAILRAAYKFFWRRYPDPFVTVGYLFFITSFQISSDRLTGLEQRIVMVLICYFVIAMLAPARRYSTGPAVAGLAPRPSRVLPAQS